MPLLTFIVTSILARGLRFYIVAFLLWKFGAPIRDFIERRLGLMFILFCALLLGGFYVVKFLLPSRAPILSCWQASVLAP